MCDCHQLHTFRAETEHIKSLTASERLERLRTSLEGSPFAVLKPSIAPDGDKWSVLYGSNIQQGVVGFGDTPMSAAEDFNNNWHTQQTPVARQLDGGEE